MIGLLAIGLALIFGIGVRIAGITGALLMFMMYLSANIWAEGSHNPLFDDHIVYMFILVYFAFKPEAGNWVGLGSWWKNIKIVKQFPVLQ
jgi:thiosulfate dehydrogenase [quinone] large subunit